MEDTALPNPSSTIIYFMLATLCFAFFTISNIFQASSYEKVEDAVNNNIINSVYILLLVVGSYFINANISKSMCSQSIQWSYILMITLLPWVIIFVSLYFILKLFPGWVAPFSNTIGFVIIGLLGVEKTYKDIFKSNKDAVGNSELIKAIANMNSNKTQFINQISTDLKEFDKFFADSAETLKPDHLPHKLELYKLLVVKQALGKIVWYVLAGILISSISYNLVISMACEKSLEEIKKDFDSAREKNEQAAIA